MSAFTHSFLTASSCCVGRCGALAVLAWMVGAIGLAPAPAAAQTPSVLLGAEDELRIRIYQWPELSGDYVIGARGNVSLPLVGPIPAAGITEEDLAGRISDVLKARARLTDAPTTAVEVAQYRPFYIMGDVDRPGAFPYRPGMLVLNAVSLAGGYYRKTEQAWQRFERDALSAAGDSRELADQIARQTLRIVRLEAERDGLDSFTVPLELRYGGDVQALAEQEQALLRSRSETLRMQLEEYAAVSEELTTHIALVEAQDRERTAELNLTDARIERLETLAAKRLVSEVELMALQAQASNIRREQIQLNVQVLEAKTRQRELADAATSLNHDHMGEVLTSLQAAQAELEELQNQQWKAERLYVEAATASSGETTDTVERVFTLVRTVEGETTKLPVSEIARVLPGDIITVTRVTDPDLRLGQ